MDSSRRRFLLGLTTAVLLTIALYWPTLRLPLMYDSLLHMRITSGLTLGNVWLPTEAFGFYRPMTFFPMLLIERLFGRYPAALLHGLNVAQHGLNVALLGWLVWRLWRQWLPATVAALLFGWFPFSYQAVAVYGHNVHPAIVNVLLLGLHAYLTAQNGRSWLWWLATAVLFGLALLTHESAVLWGPLAALVQWSRAGDWPDWRARAWWQQQRPWLILTALGLAYLVLYQFLPISRAPQAEALTAGNLGMRLLYLAQALVYPLAWLGQRLGGATAVGIVLISLLLALLLAAWRWRVAANRWPLLLGLGWATLAYGLIAVPLSTTYLLHGPRLLYLGSVGGAIWLTALLVGFGQQQRTVAAVGGLLTLAVLGINGRFVQNRLLAYAQLTEPVRVVMERMADRPLDEGVLLVNLPQWLDAPQAAFPVGVEFVSMLGDYLFVEELVQYNLNQPRPAQATVVTELLTETPYAVGLHGQTAVADINWDASQRLDIFVTRYGERGPQTQLAGWMGGETAVPLATFGAYQLLDVQPSLCTGALTLRLTWQHDPTAVSPTLSVFVQALGDAGQLVAQADGAPFGLRPDLLDTPRPYTEIRRIPAGLEPLTLLLGVYDFVTGARLSGLDDMGRPLPDNALRVEIRPCAS